MFCERKNEIKKITCNNELSEKSLCNKMKEVCVIGTKLKNGQQDSAMEESRQIDSGTTETAMGMCEFGDGTIVLS